MKIYHKKNFAAGLFFTLLGAAFIVLFLVRGNIQPKSVVFCRVDELDERNILVKLRTKSTAFSIVQYTLLGVCALCAIGAVLYEKNPDGQLVLGGMLIVSGVVWFISLLAELFCGLHYEEKL